VDFYGGGGITTNGPISVTGGTLSFNIAQANYVMQLNSDLSATGNIIINTALASSVNSLKTITSGGNILLNGNADSSLSNFSGSSNGFNFLASSGTVSFARKAGLGNIVNVNANNITFGADWDPLIVAGNPYPVGTVSLTSVNSLILPTITANSIFARTTGAAADITIPSGKVLTASATGTPITLVAGRNFINSAGAGAFNLTNAGAKRWLVYSSNPTGTTGEQTLSSNFNRYSCGFSAVGACALNATLGTTISIPGTGNGFLYSYTPMLTATPTAISSITYGDAAPNLTGYAYNALTSGQYLSAADFAADTVTGALTGSTTYTQGSNVGSYNINYSSGSLASAMGYGFSYANNASAFTVGQRAVTATATAGQTKVYGAANPGTYAYTITGGSLYSSDSLGTLTARAAGENVGNYAISNTLSNSNYNITYAGANFGITPYTLAVTAAAKSKIYGAADPALTYSYGTLQNGDTSAIFSGALSRAAGETVVGGPYAILQNTLSAGSNYTISYTGANLNINPYTLSVAADAKSKIYGAADPALTYSYGTLQNGDTSAVFSGALSRGAGETPGSYVIGQNTLSLSANYSLNYINGLLTITSTALPDTVVRVGQNPSLLTATDAAWSPASRQDMFAWNTPDADADAGTRYHLRTGSDPTAAQPFLRWLDSMRAILTLHPTLAKRLGLETDWSRSTEPQPR
jgi:hypothetical protein